MNSLDGLIGRCDRVLLLYLFDTALVVVLSGYVINYFGLCVVLLFVTERFVSLCA